MSKVLITAVAGVLLCVGSILSVYAATWDGTPASGDWGTDNWGLSGEWPGEDFTPGGNDRTAEDATIGDSGHTVTVQSGNTYTSSGSLSVKGTLIVEGTLNYTGWATFQRGWITVQGNGSMTMGTMQALDRKQVTVKGNASFEVVDGNVLKTGFIIQDSATVDLNAMQLRVQGIDLYGGMLTTDNGSIRFAAAPIWINGGVWNESGTFGLRGLGNGTTSLIDVDAGAANIAGNLNMYDETKAAALVVDISGGSLDVDGDVIFSYQDDAHADDTSHAVFTVDGSAGTINLGGITFRDSPDPTPSSKFSFKADSAAPFVSTITVDGAAVPDFSDLVLELADSDAYPGSGDIGVIFAIPGTTTQATPFSNVAEGETVSFVDEGEAIVMQVTYAGGDGNDIELTKVTVSNEDPVAIDISTNAVEDVVLVITVSATDADGDTLTFSEDTAPSHGALSDWTQVNASNATVTYTPDLNYNGTDSFVFLVEDDYVSDTGVVSITISPTSDPPEADAVSVTTFEDQAVLVTLSGSDPDGDSVTFSTANDPTNGTVTLLDNEYVLYTPDASYTGGDSFTYVVNDGSEDSAPATVSITVVDPATADDWQTDRWGLDSPDGWPGDANYPTTKATIDSPAIVALTDQGGATSGSVTWTGGGQVIGNTGIALVGTNGVMTFGSDAYLAQNSTAFTTVLSDNGIINYSGTSHALGGHLRLNDSCLFSNANASVSFRLRTVTLNGGSCKPDSSGGLGDQTTTWIFNGGSLDVAGGNLDLNSSADRSCRYYFHDGLLDVGGNFLADDNGNSPARLAVIGTGMGAAGADSTGLKVGAAMRVGGDAAGEMQTTMIFNFDDTTGVDYWDIGGDLTLNNGNGNAILDIDLGAYDTGKGTTGVVLFDYTGSRSGTFDSVTVVSDEGPLTPGTLGDLDFLEYAIDYGSGTADTVKLHAYSLRLPTGTVIAIQ